MMVFMIGIGDVLLVTEYLLIKNALVIVLIVERR
jgi:hypothetical protein